MSSGVRSSAITRCKPSIISVSSMRFFGGESSHVGKPKSRCFNVRFSLSGASPFPLFSSQRFTKNAATQTAPDPRFSAPAKPLRMRKLIQPTTLHASEIWKAVSQESGLRANAYLTKRGARRARNQVMRIDAAISAEVVSIIYFPLSVKRPQATLPKENRAAKLLPLKHECQFATKAMSHLSPARPIQRLDLARRQIELERSDQLLRLDHARRAGDGGGDAPLGFGPG